MGADLSKVSLLARREIEARIAGPLIKAFIEEVGREKAMALVEPVINELARQSGAALAKMAGGTSLADFARATSVFSADNAHDSEILEESDTRRYVNVTRCAYVDMYKELGLSDLGYLLSCGRDFEMFKGFNPKMKLVRTKTIMQGDDHCDFRTTLK